MPRAPATWSCRLGLVVAGLMLQAGRTHTRSATAGKGQARSQEIGNERSLCVEEPRGRARCDQGHEPPDREGRTGVDHCDRGSLDERCGELDRAQDGGQEQESQSGERSAEAQVRDARQKQRGCDHDQEQQKTGTPEAHHLLERTVGVVSTAEREGAPRPSPGAAPRSGKVFEERRGVRSSLASSATRSPPAPCQQRSRSGLA